ncbi:FAD-dependent oxidoreductase [Paenibacillus xanthanilyticus]|uniref:FAD-dependent oxidoreductase n=1 Tax=Paenibacillus xanthanilyticus TaxID=1783531 RepID=A0ABV8KBP4_9BACL
MTIKMEADIVVAGGGPAGLCAAVAAGRSGKKTVLVERYGFVGGMTSAALVYPWMTFHTLEGKQVIAGLAQEIVDRLQERGASPGHMRDTVGFTRTLTPFKLEEFQVLAVDMLEEAGVQVLFHSFVEQAHVEDGQIKSLTLATKSGPIQLEGKAFVDTTGDADVAFLAGVPCLKGREGDGKTQPMTLKFRMRGVDLAKVKAYMLEHPEEFYKRTPVGELPDLELTGVCGFYKHWKDAALPINRDQVLFFAGPGDDEVLVNTTRVQGLDGTDVEQLSAAEAQGRRQALQVAQFMKRHLPGFEKASISQIGAQIGVRESRRIDGVYVLETEDVVSGRRFADVIARSGYPIDVHDPTGQGVKSEWVRGDGAYDIPYRSLVARGVGNLLAAGRCISTSHEALGTTRLTPSCMSTGQAAGTAAALALDTGASLVDLDVARLQSILRDNGAILN